MFQQRLVTGVVGAVLRAGAAVLRAVGITVGRRPVPPPTDCNDPGPAPCGSNPRTCGSSQALVFGPTGALAEYAACGPGPHTQVRTQGGIRGLDAAARGELRFAPTPTVTVQVAHFSSPGRIEAKQGGAVADVRFMAATPGVVQEFTLNGIAIDQIVVTPASPTDITLIIGWCH